jgi:hypothetical protein
VGVLHHPLVFDPLTKGEGATLGVEGCMTAPGAAFRPSTI